MREKILAALREAGHGLIPQAIWEELQDQEDFWETLLDMENDKLVILHRADGSAGTQKGEIVLVALRNNF